jgi:hypothetical protein
MKNLKLTLIATGIGTAVGFRAWLFGLGQMIWPAHPQIASFLLTLVTTIVIPVWRNGGGVAFTCPGARDLVDSALS